MVSCVDDEVRGKRGPVVLVEDGATQELHEPWPVGVLVVVAGDVEAEPAAAMFHVVVEGGALGTRMGGVVEPEDDVVFRECVGGEGGPVCRRVEGKLAVGGE